MSKALGRSPDGMKPKIHFEQPVIGGPACAPLQYFPTTTHRKRVTCLNCRESVAYKNRA